MFILRPNLFSDFFETGLAVGLTGAELVHAVSNETQYDGPP